MVDQHIRQADENNERAVQYKAIAKGIVQRFLSGDITGGEAAMEIMDRVDMEYVLDSEDELLDAAYWSVRHLTDESGFETTESGIRYLLKCLSGTEEYSFEGFRKALACENDSTI